MLKAIFAPGPLPDFSFQEHLWQRALECKEEVYKGIMRQILGREPTQEDGKDVTIAYREGDFTRELFAYKGAVCGMVVQEESFSPETGFQFGYTFYPNITQF